MSKFTRGIALTLFMLVLISPIQALAAPAAAPVSNDLGAFLQILQQVLGVIKGMTALAAVLTLLVNFLKSRGYIPDGASDIAFQILNVVAIVALSLVKFFNPEFDFGAFDALLQAMLDNFAIIVPEALMFPAQLGMTKISDSFRVGNFCMGESV